VIDVVVSFWEGSRAARRGRAGTTFGCRKTILHQESFPILYFLSHPSTSTFICYFSLLHLHLKFFLILYFHSHPSTSYYYYARGIAGERQMEVPNVYRTKKCPSFILYSCRRCFSLVDFMKKLMTLVQQREIQRCDPPECAGPTPLRSCHPTTTDMMLFSTIVHYYH
jgi:hypothetical protein